MGDLYAPYVRQGNPIFIWTNAHPSLPNMQPIHSLATKITFMNEIANMCELVGADVDMVRKGVGADARIGKRFLFPGVGYGGSCFPKDVQALSKAAEENKYEFKILNSVMEVNETQKKRLVVKMRIIMEKGALKGKHFALWGLAFKPETDDIREAPALYIIDELLAAGATVTAYDPEGMPNVKKAAWR
jgi:UDPglucose 6-dehydrogenase